MAPSDSGNSPPPSPKGKGKAKQAELSAENLAALQKMVIRLHNTSSMPAHSSTTNSPVDGPSAQTVAGPSTGGSNESSAKRNDNSSTGKRPALSASDVSANAAAINARAHQVQIAFNSLQASHDPIGYPSDHTSPPPFTTDQDDDGNVYSGHFVCFRSLTAVSGDFFEVLTRLVGQNGWTDQSYKRQTKHTRSDSTEEYLIWFNDIGDARNAVHAIRAQASDIIEPYFITQDYFDNAAVFKDGQHLIPDPAPFPGQVVFTAAFLGNDETNCRINEAQTIVSAMASTVGPVFTIHPIDTPTLFPASNFLDVPYNTPTPQYRVEFCTVDDAERALKYWNLHTGRPERSHCGKYYLFTSAMTHEADSYTAMRDVPTPETTPETTPNDSLSSSSLPVSSSYEKSVVSSTGRTKWKELANGEIQAVQRAAPSSNVTHGSTTNHDSRQRESRRSSKEPAFHNDHLYARMAERPVQSQHNAPQMAYQPSYQQGTIPQGAYPQMGQPGPSNYHQHVPSPLQPYQASGPHHNGGYSNYQRRNHRTYHENFYNNWAAPRGKKPEEVVAENIRNGTDVRTTIMLRNIPNDAVLADIKAALERSCFGRFDFVYLRFDFQKNKNVGYGFVNFDSPETILRFLHNEEGRPYMAGSHREIQVSYAMNQGLDCLIEKFRNSSVMDENPNYVPHTYYTYRSSAEEGQPVLVGTKKDFPKPNNFTKKKRSQDNAIAIGLYPRNGHQRPDRRYRSQYDRGNPAQLQEDQVRQFGGPGYQNGPAPFMPPPTMLPPAAQTYPIGPWLYNNPQQYMQTQSFQPQYQGAYPVMPPPPQNANFPPQQFMPFNNGSGNFNNNYVHDNGFAPGNSNHQNYQFPPGPHMYTNGYAPGMSQTNVPGNGQATPHWSSQRTQAARMPRVLEEEEALATNDAARNNLGAHRPPVVSNAGSNGAATTQSSGQQQQQMENNGTSTSSRNGRKHARR
ncbi:Hypothetical protein R9X50_00366700 [Acrodontium crateriforme]|uniref:RRM domain-containing protein n=1 Tax=Acrodontium crateriforme TaxID=150365 RepID=A0AAQ3M2X9_9PEZI|nr:Hypothetical protein R9X50_00366700 [Acrodontium crateriforme]